MKPNQNNHKKKHGTFMYPGSTGFKFKSSYSRSEFAPRISQALLVSLVLFMAVVAFNPIVAIVFATLSFVFQMTFASTGHMLGEGLPPADQEAALLEKIKGSVSEKFDTLVKENPELIELKKLVDEFKNAATKAELKVIGDKLTALKFDEVKQVVVELEAKFKALNENGKPGVVDMSVRNQIKSAIEKNKDKWEAFKKGEVKMFDFELDFKAADTMTVATNTSSSAFVPTPEMVPGLVELARNRPFIEAYANTSGTSSPRIVWAEKTNPQGNAGFIAEGTVKPLIDFDIETNESYAKKVADKIKVSTEMLEDIDFIAAEIENELRYQVDIKVDTELLSGAGNGTSGATTLKGLTQYAGGYVLTTIATPTPNNFDAIRAAIAQIISLNFNPTHVFINPIDGANMDLVKDENGRPLSMEYRANGSIYRLTPIETNQMALGQVLVGDMSKFIVRNYKPFNIQYGWVNDDFEKNLVTIIGERRLHDYVADNNTGAFVYDDFATIKAAITEVPVP